MAASAIATTVLVSGDGQRLVVPIEDAYASKVICTIARASARFREGAEDCINFPSITSAVLSEVVRFLPLKRALDAALASEKSHAGGDKAKKADGGASNPKNFRTKLAQSIRRFDKLLSGQTPKRVRHSPAYEAAKAEVRLWSRGGVE